jgi:hypothetical protein
MTHSGSGSERRWQPDPNDAIRLAALRWFALEIEKLAIELYASDRATYRAMEDVLTGTVRQMGELSKKLMVQDEECPEGYERCKDGLCAPMCDGIITDNNNES